MGQHTGALGLDVENLVSGAEAGELDPTKVNTLPIEIIKNITYQTFVSCLGAWTSTYSSPIYVVSSILVIKAETSDGRKATYNDEIIALAKQIPQEALELIHFDIVGIKASRLHLGH